MVLIRPESLTSDDGENVSSYKSKTPKRVLHFSDGVLEEYSTDEEDNVAPPSQEVVNPATLPWGPWVMYKAWTAGSSTLSFIDYLGETFASLFGITTPRYYFELEEYKRRQRDSEKEAEERRGWSQTSNTVVDVPLKNINNDSNQQFVDTV